MSTRKLGVYASKEEFLENEIRTLNHHIQSMIDTMKVMSMNRQAMSDEIERLKLEVVAEREACASECDEWIKNGSTLAEDIAAAIRARGTHET